MRPAKLATRTFRIGKVKAYVRGKVWYLCYQESGQRRRPRVGPDREVARKLAAQINGQLEGGVCSVLNFEPISILDLRNAWLDHHEHVLRSSVHTINRYRTATDHLLRFIRDVRPVKRASDFSVNHAEEFVRYLRTIEVAPNGHRNTAKRRLMDKGVRFILEACRALFSYAVKRRHLSPYAGNPIADLNVDRIPVEDAKPIAVFTPEEQRRFLDACDDWQFPVFLTLMLTGLRPGELCHLLVEDVDLSPAEPVLRVRNKRQLGWQVKNRNERGIPLLGELAAVLRVVTGTRRQGPFFMCPGHRRVECRKGAELELALAVIITEQERRLGHALDRLQRLTAARSLWREIGAVREDRLRLEFIKVTAAIGLTHVTAPKVLRHVFATTLQDGNVDPLIRNQLMGHVPAGTARAGSGLGMTSVYTHSRPETVRRQLELSWAQTPPILAAARWAIRRQSVAEGLVP
jgi:integrase